MVWVDDVISYLMFFTDSMEKYILLFTRDGGWEVNIDFGLDMNHFGNINGFFFFPIVTTWGFIKF